MSDLFRSAGLVPVAGTIDWLTRRCGKKLFSAGLAPVESTTRSRITQSSSVMRSTGTSPARGGACLRGRPLAGSISARRGQAPDVAEQNQHQDGGVAKLDFAHASPALLLIY